MVVGTQNRAEKGFSKNRPVFLSVIIQVQPGKQRKGGPRPLRQRPEVKCPEVSHHRRKPATRQVSAGASRAGSGPGSSWPGAWDRYTGRGPRGCRGLTLSVIFCLCALS